MTSVEFSRPERVETIGQQPRTIDIAAGPAEREALARRFDLVEITRLAATLSLWRDAAGIRARGRVTGDVVQRCTVTEDPVPASIDEAVDLRFVERLSAPAAAEVELSADDCDLIEYEGGAVDLGEAAAETLALALDPFPRGPNAATALREAGVLSESDAGPFGALAGLRDKLTDQSR